MGVHRLLELGVLEAAAALEDDDALRVDAGRLVELGQPPGGDRAAEAAAGDADVEALAHGRLPCRVRSVASLRR